MSREMMEQSSDNKHNHENLIQATVRLIQLITLDIIFKIWQQCVDMILQFFMSACLN